MKKLVLLTLSALGMLACTEKNTPQNNGGSTDSQEISCEPSEFEFDVSESGNLMITLTSLGAWTATTNADWISVEPMSGQGSAFVKVSYKIGPMAEGSVLFSTEKASAKLLLKRIDKYPGTFPVSATKRVVFSKGNLQYQASTKKWRFAEHQYDVIGAKVNAENIGNASYSGWLDLFAWGTSGYKDRLPNEKYNISDYNPINLEDISETNYDWGVYNAISNGGNQRGLWRTLTYKEYYYLAVERPNAGSLRGSATIDGKKGKVYLPQGWVCPSGATFNAMEENVYDRQTWAEMEEAGAIFLPAGGEVTFEYKRDPDITMYTYYEWFPSYFEYGMNYWTATKGRILTSGNYNPYYPNAYFSVRLVKDVE